MLSEERLQALLDAEAALAGAAAQVGLIPADAAAAIAEKCTASLFDAAVLDRQTAASGTPVLPLVQALRELVPEDMAVHVHSGATSQDILDSAAMLMAQRARAGILDDLAAVIALCAALADRHRHTRMVGRTLLQQAAPTTFGLKAAGWMTTAAEARELLARTRLAAQLGGAVGNLAAVGRRGPALAEAFAARIGLPAPLLPWHAVRNRVAELGAALAITVGALGKIATDVKLMAQDEVAEVSERHQPGRGASSALPHKRNPVAAVRVSAAAVRAPGLAATLMAAMAGEHERAAGAWQAEWATLDDLLGLTVDAAASARDMLEGIQIDPLRMRANLGERAGDAGPVDQLIDRALEAYAP